MDEESLESLDDAVELITGATLAILVMFQILAPDSDMLWNLFSLLVSGLIWSSYKIAKVKHAVGLRLLVVAFSYQIFGVWVIGIFLMLFLGSFFTVILMSFIPGFDLFTIGFIASMIMMFLITLGSRNAAKEFASRRWDELVSDTYSNHSYIEEYRNSALALVDKVLPHGLILFLLFFLIYGLSQATLWISPGAEIIVSFLLLYILYRGYVFNQVQKKENTEW